MHQPQILLIGKIGQVGWELRRTLAPLGRVECLDYPELDMAKAAGIRAAVRRVRPNFIVNAAAYTAVDKAESEPAQAMKINGIAPGILAEEAKALGAMLVHYSTDYVFDGYKTTPYVEDDGPNPLGAYGKSKLAGELAVQQSGCCYLIFRLCWVYGARGRNFMLTIQRLAREQEKVRVVADQVGAPTWSRLIGEATALALKQVIGQPDNNAFTGIYHLAANGQTSWHGFAQAIVGHLPEEAKKCHQVEPLATSAYPLPAKRPAFSVLSCEKLKKVFGLSLPDWAETLKMVVESQQ